MPAFVKTPRFILGAILVLWVLYVIYANYQFDLIKFYLLPFGVFVGMRVSSLILASAIFGAAVTLVIQWLWRRDVNSVSSVTAPPASAPSVSVPPTNKTIA